MLSSDILPKHRKSIISDVYTRHTHWALFFAVDCIVDNDARKKTTYELQACQSNTLEHLTMGAVKVVLDFTNGYLIIVFSGELNVRQGS